MPEYVYALHDFLPEHEDEVTFHAGERVEVVEKDDLYGDGWWQGRNLAGRVGLFPVSYTAPAPPAATAIAQTPSSSSTITPEEAPAGTTPNKPALQPLKEEPESDSSPPDIVSPVPKQPPATFLNGDGYESDLVSPDDTSIHLASMPDDGVMKATMTDVQKAIEQLGRGAGAGEDGDGARSFSFASTRDGADTETDDTDFDLSDVDGGVGDSNGEDWHKNARRKLAAKARRAVEEAEKLEAMLATGDSPSGRRSIAPPIEVELSDESEAEDEGDFTRSSKFQRQHPYILEEDENEEAEAGSSHTKEPSATATQRSSTVDHNQVLVPARDETDIPTATAENQTFPVFSPPPPAAIVEHPRPVSPPRHSYPTPTSPPPPAPPAQALPAVALRVTTPEQKRSSGPIKETPVSNGLPSPSASSHFNALTSKHNSVISSSSAPPMTTPAPQAQQALSHSPAHDLKKTHPSEWNVEEVVEWLKSKGFDQDVCDKFIEQEITGDVLLELDVNLLKTEIGIMAFGKRMRIANAITDLRRPPSIEYSDHNTSEHPSPMNLQHSNTHSRTQSQSQSHHSFPGTLNPVPGHNYTQSIQSSLGSPMGYGNGFGFGSQNQSQFETVQESPSASVDRTVEMGAVASVAAAAAVGVGLGIGMPSHNEPTDGSRSTHLMLSPSDGALKDSAAKSLSIPQAAEEDRGHMSDGEIVPTATSMRRRLFGRSQDSTLSALASRQSPIPSPTLRETPDKELKDKDSTKKDKDSTKEGKDKDKDSSSLGSRHARAKKSIDGSKPSDRLSIFGGTFGGTLGKSRKPPPTSVEPLSEKPSSKFSLPRLHGSSIRKTSSTSQRPITPSQSPQEIFISPSLDQSPKEQESPRNSKTLRKRTISAPPPGTPNGTQGTVNGVSVPIKQGQNILEQIGEPDHTGWMRKKGDRYNSWKLRYFILKGPHLYILRSNSKSETRIKGYVHIVGYKVTVDENIDPGRYGFRIDHDHDKTHCFSSEEKTTVRDWMKAIMKATIGRDYTKPVVSSCNIPTIPLVVAQAMNPAPRPPSPTARDATQKALRRENPDQLSSRDARVLMGLQGNDAKDDRERTRLDTFFSDESAAANDFAFMQPSSPRKTTAPPRPSREMRRSNSQRTAVNPMDESLIEWANTHLPEHLQITDPTGPLCGGLAILRLAESIKGRPSSPPVADSAFPVDAHDDKLDGLFRLFDFLLDNDVKIGSVSINDIRQGKRDKIVQLLRALKTWEDKRRALANTIAKGSMQMQAGASFMMPVVMT